MKITYSEPTTKEYYTEAFYEEMMVLWGETKFADELHSLCHMAAQTCWLNNTPNDISDRRKLVKAMAKGMLDEESLRRYERIIPSSNIIDKYTSTVATLYNTSPTRLFSQTDDDLNSEMDSIYKSVNANSIFKKAYRYALFVNTVAVYPAYTSTGKLVFRVLTPDLFRLVVDDDGEIVEFWSIHAIKQSGSNRQVTEFAVWTNEWYYRTDYRGIPIKGSEIENPYGRIPRAILRLDEPVTSDPYGGGDSDITELNIWKNIMRLSSTRTAIFQSFSVGIATNMELAPGTRIAPDSLLQVNHDNPELAPPHLTFESPNPTFEMVEDYARNVVREEFRSKGIPSFILDDSGTPPTGIALTIMERELTEKRKGHIAALSAFESDMASLVASVVNIDGNRPPALQLPVVFDDFTLSFITNQTLLAPKEQFDLDMMMAAQGMVYPSTIVAKYVGIEGGLTDEEAVQIRNENKRLWLDGLASPESNENPVE